MLDVRPCAGGCETMPMLDVRPCAGGCEIMAMLDVRPCAGGCEIMAMLDVRSCAGGCEIMAILDVRSWPRWMWDHGHTGLEMGTLDARSWAQWMRDYGQSGCETMAGLDAWDHGWTDYEIFVGLYLREEVSSRKIDDEIMTWGSVGGSITEEDLTLKSLSSTCCNLSMAVHRSHFPLEECSWWAKHTCLSADGRKMISTRHIFRISKRRKWLRGSKITWCNKELSECLAVWYMTCRMHFWRVWDVQKCHGYSQRGVRRMKSHAVHWRYM